MANINKIRLSGQTYDIQDPNAQPLLTAGQGITIENNVISATGGGGKAVSGGTNISITTGETADTINCTLPYYIDSGGCWTIFGESSNSNVSKGTNNSVYIGSNNKINNTNISVSRQTTRNIIIGWRNKLDSYYDGFGLGYNVVVGHDNTLSGSNNIRESYVIGRYNTGHTSFEFICGWSNEVRNNYETSFGQYNNSVSGSSTFGDSGNTLFSVGNGTVDARHNAFEIRQNGDIYITSGGTDIKLQDALGGGGSSYTAGDGIDITNDVISVTGKVDTSAFTAHTADTVIHVTSAEKAAWNAKSDFSGSYNDLTNKPTIPTVPTSNTAFTNDAGYITIDAISGKADTSAVTESINAAVSGKADTSDVFITSSNRNSIVSNIHEEVYQLSSDDIYSITAVKALTGDVIYCQIMIDNTLYYMQGSSSSITYSDAALSGLVTADFSFNMSIELKDRENHHINEIFIEAYNLDDNSYIKEITITHNPPIGVNKIDYVASIYTEFVHDKYAMKADLNSKQDTLVSGTNIKTINNQSILGSGNITIQGGGTIDQTVISGSTNAVAGGAVYTQLDGLKLQKITQSAYDALQNKDANTLYIING